MGGTNLTNINYSTIRKVTFFDTMNKLDRKRFK